MVRRTLEIRACELPPKLRGEVFSGQDLVRVTIERVEGVFEKITRGAGKLRAGDLIGLARQLGEPPQGDGSNVEADLRALREEWER